MKDKLLELANRVEGPSRDIDDEIAKLVGHPFGRDPCAPFADYCSRHYTSSIDDALMLVPWPDNQTGLSFWIMKDYPGFTRCQVWHSDRSYAGYGVDVPEGDGRTKALALTAAALRALAQEQGDA